MGCSNAMASIRFRWRGWAPDFDTLWRGGQINELHLLRTCRGGECAQQRQT
jgi:hypothetical protein